MCQGSSNGQSLSRNGEEATPRDTQRGIAQRVRREFASQRRSLHVCQSRRHQPRPVSSLEIDQRTLCRYSKLVTVGQTDRRQTDSLEPLDSPSPTGLQAPSVPLTGTVRAFRDLLRGDFLFPRETERERELSRVTTRFRCCCCSPRSSGRVPVYLSPPLSYVV